MKRVLCLLILINCFTCSASFAKSSSLVLGLSYLCTNTNDKDFDYINKYEEVKNPKEQLKNLSLGYSTFYKNFNSTLSTNRIFSRKSKRSVIRKADNILFKSQTKLTVDSLTLGYRVDRFNPAIVLANVTSSNHLLYNGSVVAYEKKSTIVGGVQLGYFVTRNLIPSLVYILPNKELDLEGALTVNFNYLF